MSDNKKQDQQDNKQHHGMGKRGVTRPMEMMDHMQGGMDQQQRMKMMQMHHQKTHWIYWLLIILGIWMLLSPASIDYGKNPVQPAGGRSLWLSLETRVLALQISDVLCGLGLIVFGIRTLKPNRPVSLWICCLIGCWLNFAPLLFWAPQAVIYFNDTLVGMLVIALTILIPGMPNMLNYMKMGPDRQKGWSYNPSSWPQRSIMIALGFAGLVVSRYLAMFQLGYIDTVWDPFFGQASQKVLTSKMSESLFISDGGFGAFAYTFEFLMGWMGSPARWRTMPWMVTFFGILVIPLGLVHIFLVISQPVIVGHWCTFCLTAAAIMLPMIPLEVDEVIAMCQFMVVARKQGQPFWRSFFKGGIMDCEKDEVVGIHQTLDKPGQVFRASIYGMSFPWTLILSMIIGIWLMFSPAVFGNEQIVADIEHLGGALIVTVSVIAMGEVVRSMRFLNILLGLIIGGGAVFASGAWTTGIINDLIAGLFVIGLAVPKGKITQSYGSWNRFIK